MTKVCGCGPDIIKINDHEEIGCHCSDVCFRFTDGTDVDMYYMRGKWNIDVARLGTADMRILDGEFYIDANILTFEVIDR